MVTYYYAIENCCYQSFLTKTFSKNEKNAKISGKKRVFNKNEFQNVYPIFRDLGPYDSNWVHMIQFGSS